MCAAPLETARGIEMGHIFQLGRTFAEALDLQVLDENGKLVTVTMGSYGIGVSRAVAALVENSHDELGIIWPREVSPADVHLVATGKDAEVFATADRLCLELEAEGLTVLYDDRQKVSPGVKFKDAELIGVPTIVVVGKGLVDGVVEVKDRTHAASARTSPSSRRRTTSPGSSVALDAVLFDWGGTLTPWRTIDPEGGVGVARCGRRRRTGTRRPPRHWCRAAEQVWARSRDEHSSATIEEICRIAGVPYDDEHLDGYRAFWEPATVTDADVPELFGWLRGEGIKVGVLSNTVWPRAWHEDIFVRDGIDELIDGAVYTSDIAWTKPAPEAFLAAMEAVGRPRPGGTACSSVTGSSTTSTAPRTSACRPCPCRTPTSRQARSATPKASRTP